MQEEIFRDSIATVDKQGKRNWIYAQQPRGKLYNYRTILGICLLVTLFSLPFIQVNGRPLFLLNVEEGRFIIFGIICWPQDFFLFALLMLAFILFVALFTMAFGRLFCGWACPQTIFMEMLFRRIEYWIEGDAAAQRVLARAPWNASKTGRKVLKHTIFLLLSFVIANIFLSYIIGARELGRIIREPVHAHAGGFTALLAFSGIFYAVFAFFREQVCTTVCPYGRLQSVLLDRNSVVVAYDHVRGEPRAKYKKEQPPHRQGDCIDCLQCVKVCPTGIDTRNGTQLECVNCTACIDACNFMMLKTGRLPGLIRYASENGITDQQPLRFTLRLKVYSLALALILAAAGYLLLSRTPVSGTIMRMPGMLYQQQPGDSISNLYRVKLVNKTGETARLRMVLSGSAGIIRMAGRPEITLPAGGQAEGIFFIIMPRLQIRSRKSAIEVAVFSGARKLATLPTSFYGPPPFNN